MPVRKDVSMIYVSGSHLIFSDFFCRCAIGRNGFSNGTFEGSATTPLGEFALRPGYFRADRMEKPESGVPLSAIQKDDGWCDDPAHPLYNQPVKLPFAARHEELWREDGTYDIIIPIGYNDEPVIPGRGSAIFFHCARPGYLPTLGCIAIEKQDMLALLPRLSLSTRILIGAV